MASIDSLSIQITASTGSAVTKVKALTKELVKLGIAIDALDVSKFETLSNAANGLSQGLAGLKGAGVKQIEKVGKAINSMNEAAQKDTLDAVSKDVKKVSDKSKEASEDIGKVSANIESIKPASLDEMAGSLEKVSATVKKTSSEMGAFRSILTKLKIIIPTEGLEKVDKEINKLTVKIQDLKDKLNFKSQTQAGYIDSKEMEKDQKKIDGLINELDRLKLKKQELESHGGFKFSMGKGFGEIAKSIESANKKLDGFISNIRKVNNHTKSTSKATKDFSLASMKLAKELTRVTKMLKLMVTRMILRKVIQNAIDGFKNLVQYSSEVDASVSLMWNSFRQLGNSVAAAVGPLINALAPALNYIIQLCIRVVNAINQVISALTGRSTWTRAKTLTDDYAKSLDKSNKSAKELKKTVLGFDELNQLQDNKDSGGGGMTKPEDMFEDAKIEAKWADMAQKLRTILKRLLAPIKKAWSNVGKEVVEAWKNAFESVKKLLEDIGRDFLKVWNQPKTVKMLENILRIFRDIGLIVKNLADGLDKAWNKNNTGLHILEAIRDIFAIIIQHVQNMTSATAEWADNLDFSPILNAFKDWVESMAPVVDAISGAFEDFYTNVLLPLGKWSIEKGLPELIQVFTDFNNKVQWDVIRERLNKVWSALEPFAETVGEGLVKFIGDISDTLADFLNSEAWDSFIDSLIKFMNDVDANEVANMLHIILDAFLAFKALTFLSGTVSIITKFVGAIESLTATLGVFSYALAGIVTFFVGADIGKIIGQKIFPDSAEIYRKYMGIIGTMKMLYDNVVAEKDAIVMVWEAIAKKAKENFALIGIDIDDLKKRFTEFKGHLEMKFGELQTSVKKIIADVKQGFVDFIDNVKKMFSADNWTFSGVAEGLRKTFLDAKNAIKQIWNDIANTVNGDHEFGLAKFKIHLPTFATGGFPKDDSLFMANSSEMVGKFSNGQNVVANNQQITDGIAQAVFSAIVSANAGSGSARYINNTIQIDGKTIARAVTMGQDDMNRRYSPVTT